MLNFSFSKRFDFWQEKKRAMLYYCFTLHVLIKSSQRPQGWANDQQKCVNSILEALKKITYEFKREFLPNFKVKNAAVNGLPQEGYPAVRT